MRDGRVQTNDHTHYKNSLDNTYNIIMNFWEVENLKTRDVQMMLIMCLICDLSQISINRFGFADVCLSYWLISRISCEFHFHFFRIWILNRTLNGNGLIGRV